MLWELVVGAYIELVHLLLALTFFCILFNPLLVHLVEAAEVEDVAAAEVLHRLVAVLIPHWELLHPVSNRNASEAVKALVVRLVYCLILIRIENTIRNAIGSWAEEAEGWPCCVWVWLWLLLLFWRILI